MLYVEASAAFEAVLESGETGLVGTIEVKVIDNDGATVLGPTTANITEDGTSGVYIWNAPAAPGSLGQYTIVWSTDGTFDEDTVAIDELVVVESTASTPSPIPAPEEGGAEHGPCSAWTTAEDVMACCSADVGSDPSLFDDAVDQASQLLYEFSGRLFSGLCSKSVRPLCDDCTCGYQILSRGHIVVPPGATLCDQCLLSCSPSRVRLSGFPVREVTQVKIDGAVISAAEYVVDHKRYLTRMNNSRWPIRQNLTLADTEEGTWSISYTYGQSAPLPGRAAAAELACEIYRSCNNDANCALPSGITRITRQNIVIERNAFAAWGRQEGIWRTGIPLVDVFLNAYNPAGIRRRPVFMTPGRRDFPVTR